MDNTGWMGEFVIETRDKITGAVRTETLKNRVMAAAINALADVLVGTAPNLEIKYLAFGTGNAAITDADTKLATEIFRTAPSGAHTRVSTGQIETTFTVLDSEAVGALKEIGIFVGSAATGSADSGALLSRVLWSKTKTASEELTIKRVDRIVRA